MTVVPPLLIDPPNAKKLDELISKAQKSKEEKEKLEKLISNEKMWTLFSEEKRNGETVFGVPGHSINGNPYCPLFSTKERFKTFFARENLSEKSRHPVPMDVKEHIDAAIRVNIGIALNPHSENFLAWSAEEVKTKFLAKNLENPTFQLYNDAPQKLVSEITMDENTQAAQIIPNSDFRLPEIEKAVAEACRSQPLVKSVALSCLIPEKKQNAQLESSYCLNFSLENGVSDEKEAEIIGSIMQAVGHLWPSTQPEESKKLYTQLLARVDPNPYGVIIYKR